MRNLHKILIAAISLAGATSASSYAQDANTSIEIIEPSATISSGWTRREFMVSYRGNMVKKDKRDVPIAADAIYTQNPDMAGNVALTCYGGQLSASVGLVPVDFTALFSDPPNSRRKRVKRLDLVIDGEKIKSSNWNYPVAMKVHQPQMQSIVRKLYNAAVKGSHVTLKTDGSDPVKLILPKPDAAFADFGAGCGIGRRAQQ